VGLRLDAAIRDLRFAARLIRRRPLLTAAAVATVALGVGANTAVVSVLQTVLLNPLGLRDARRVMVATVRFEGLQMRGASNSGVEFRELQSMTDAFSAVAALEGQTWTTEINGEPARLVGRAVTPDFFRVFGEHPMAGRFFTAEDRESVVLSHPLWRSQFGGDPSAIGRAIMLNGRPHRIVGVAGERFRYPATAQAWTPLTLSPARLRERGNNMNLAVVGRLKDGVTAAQAEDRVNRHVAAVKSPDSGEGPELTKLGYFIDMESLSHHVAGDLRRPLWLVWAAALAVLATGCANVAALLLSRTAGRKREMAIRLSLGATRRQILRQLLIESLLMGALGGGAGILVAEFAVSSLSKLVIPGRQLLELVALDYRLMLYGLGLSLACGLVFGIAPALQLLRESQAPAVARSRRRRFQDAFVAAEVAVSLVLVISAGLLLRSLWTVGQIQPGFNPRSLTTAFLLKPPNDPGFIERLQAALASTSGIEGAAVAFPIPFSGGGLTSRFSIRGRQRLPGQPEWHGEAYFVSPRYFETLRIPLLRGRAFDGSDTARSPVVCIIDSKLAERFFPNQDPIGHEIAMYRGWARIVGVAGAIRGTTLEEGSRPVVYYPLVQVPFFPQAAVIARSPGSAAGLIREAVRRTNGSVPLYDIRSMEDRIAESIGVRRVLALLVCVFAAICLLLAAIGLHGVVAQVAGERTSEIGLRMALGARPGQIQAQFLRQGLLAGGIGFLAGLPAAAYAQRWLTSLLYEIKPYDPLAILSACLGLLAVLLAAVWWPTRRASRIDPQVVLHYE
jgi:predicted permease